MLEDGLLVNQLVIIPTSTGWSLQPKTEAIINCRVTSEEPKSRFLPLYIIKNLRLIRLIIMLILLPRRDLHEEVSGGFQKLGLGGSLHLDLDFANVCRYIQYARSRWFEYP